MQIWTVSMIRAQEKGHTHTIHPFSHRKSMRVLPLHQLDAFALTYENIPPNMLAQLFGGFFSPFGPILPLRQKYQSRLGLSLLFLDSMNHSC